MNVLITGADGFVSSHLIEHILKAQPKANIYATIRKGADKKNIKHLLDKIFLIECDLTDAYSVQNAVKMSGPDKVFHLAGMSYVPTSWTAPHMTLEVNVVGTAHVLEAVRKEAKDAYVQLAGSSEEYGSVLGCEVPIKESQPLRPLSPYGVSKVGTDLLGYQYAKSYGMNIIRTRSFNMSGPRRGEEFVDSNWAKQIVEMEAGKKAPALMHGNLDAIRDFTDVRDSVKAYWALSEAKDLTKGDVFNVCSGIGYKMSYVLDQIVSASTLEEITLREDQNRMRPSDVPILIGSNAKLRASIDWSCKIDYIQTLHDLLNYWRSQLGLSEIPYC